MRRLRKWWVGLALLALGVLAVGVVLHMRTGRLGPLGPAEQEARAPAAPPQVGRELGPVEAPQPPLERFTFKAVRDSEGLILSGFVSGEEARHALIEKVKQAIPNAAVTDRLRTSDKAPPRLDEAFAFGLRHIARLPSGTITVAEDTISIAGQAPDSEAYNAITATPPNSPEGFRLDTTGLIPPVVRPYTWSATSSEHAIALAGHVPSAAARQTLGAAVREAFPDKHFVERLQPASGLPQNIDFDRAVRFALAQLAQFRTGTAELIDARLNLRGVVMDRETLAGVRAALQTGLPPGLETGSAAITLGKPSPYTFRARREAGTLTLSGYYPDAETRTAIHELVRERFFAEQIVDKLRAADGAPRNYLAGVSFGLEHLARLASGEAAVSDTSLQVNGEALYPQTAEQTMRAVSAPPLRGWTGKAEVRLRPPEQTDAQLRSQP